MLAGMRDGDPLFRPVNRHGGVIGTRALATSNASD
jgi:hypothetical protein